MVEISCSLDSDDGFSVARAEEDEQKLGWRREVERRDKEVNFILQDGRERVGRGKREDRKGDSWREKEVVEGKHMEPI